MQWERKTEKWVAILNYIKPYLSYQHCNMKVKTNALANTKQHSPQYIPRLPCPITRTSYEIWPKFKSEIHMIRTITVNHKTALTKQKIVCFFFLIQNVYRYLENVLIHRIRPFTPYMPLILIRFSSSVHRAGDLIYRFHIVKITNKQTHEIREQNHYQ